MMGGALVNTEARWVACGMLVLAALAWPVFSRADAPPGRYMAGNGTVLDTETGLTWQQEYAADYYTWAEAKTYCAGLNLEGGGWRLPNMKELQTLVDESRFNPAIDVNFFPGTPSDSFWSSSPVAGVASGAWIVNFYNGFTDLYDVSNTYRVRCVR